MATPLVASQKTHKHSSLSPSQAPLRTAIRRPTPPRSTSMPVASNLTSSVLELVYNSSYVDDWATPNGINTTSVLDLQAMAVSTLGYTWPQSSETLMPMVVPSGGQYISTIRPYGDRGIPQANVSFGDTWPNSHTRNFPLFQDQHSIEGPQGLTSSNNDHYGAYTTAAQSAETDTASALPTSTGFNPFLVNTTDSIVSPFRSTEYLTSSNSPIVPPTSSQSDHSDLVIEPQTSNKQSGSCPSKRKTKSAQSPENKKRAFQISRSKTKYSILHPNADFQVWKPQGRSPKPKTPQERAKVARTRRVRACDYHQKSKKACDPTWRPYIQCRNVPIRNFDIFLIKPEQIQLFRQRPATGHPLSSQRPELFQLQEISGSQACYFNLKHLTLSQGFNNSFGVWVSPFSPSVGEKTDHVWFRHGQRMTIGMPRYCIANLRTARDGAANYIRHALPDYVQHVLQNSGDLVREVLSYAFEYQYSNQTKSTLVDRAIRLLAASRMIERDWHVIGANSLGIQLIMEEDCPWYGKVPIPPMMDTQLDQIVIQDYLTPLAHELLRDLQEKLYDENKENLFEIYLTTFILATNLEWVLRHSRRNAKRYNAKHRYNHVPLQQAYILGHNVLLTHFHYLTKGSAISASGDTGGISDGSGLTQAQLDFVSRIRSKMLAQREYWERIHREKQYEAELYWSHQLFRGDWEPESTDIVDEVVAF